MSLDVSEGLSKKELSSPVSSFIIPVETAFFEEMTIEELLRSLQGKKISHEIRYFYAIDHEKRLKGVIATRDLLFCKPHTTLKELTRKKAISIQEKATVEKALAIMAQHELLALPIIDEQNHLLGLFELSTKTLLPSTKKVLPRETKSFRDVFQLIGLTVELGKLTSSRKEFRYRMPWLLCNIASGLFCALIVSFHEALLCQFAVIAMFIPLVLTLSESVAMQSMTLNLRLLHFEKIGWKKILSRFFVEWKTAVWLAIACSLLVSLFYVGWFHNYVPLSSITASLFVCLFAATTFGSFLPIVLHKFSLDPKVASGPVVLMLTDIVVTLVYLAFSSWLLL